MNAEERLHFGFLGEPFLFPNFRIDSFPSLIGAVFFVGGICLSERLLTLAISRRWNPLPVFQRTRLRVSIWRAGMYWVATMERMLYMLAAMSLNLWILLVIVTSLTAGQFIIELTEHSGGMVPGNDNHSDLESGYLLPRRSQDVHGVKEPLLAISMDDYELNSSSPYQEEYRHPSMQTRISLSTSPANSYPHPIPPMQMSPSFQYTPPVISEQTAPATTRPRSKSKPDGIFIHPTHSNIVRAEVIATRMGFGTENNEYVDSSSYTYPRSPSQSSDTPARASQRGWGTGNGRDVARGLLGASSSFANPGP